MEEKRRLLAPFQKVQGSNDHLLRQVNDDTDYSVLKTIPINCKFFLNKYFTE